MTFRNIHCYSELPFFMKEAFIRHRVSCSSFSGCNGCYKRAGLSYCDTIELRGDCSLQNFLEQLCDLPSPKEVYSEQSEAMITFIHA